MSWPGTYDALLAEHSWEIPERMSLAEQVCDGRAMLEPERLAIIELTAAGRRDVTYGALWTLSRRIEAALLERGVERGERVGVLLSQSAFCAAAHIALWRMGAVSVPLFKLFQHDALASRLGDCGARFVITDAEGMGLLLGLEVRTLTEDELTEPVAFAGAAHLHRPDDPAVLIYTSGTTGAPKGALHGHRLLAGHLPGVIMSHDGLGQPGDVLWSPADWAWIGGLFDVAMPGLALGVPVVAARMAKFDAESCLRIVSQASVRNIFFPPTALRVLKAAEARIGGLRSVASGGEPLGAEMLAWGREALGVTINEFYGQTECNMIVSSAGSLFAPKPGCIGKPVPGHHVEVIDAEGRPTHEEGDIAARRGTPVMFLEYMGKPEETAEKFRGDWMLTGDRGIWSDGYLRFVGREDDVITSAGYRIGPAEIEDCLLTHPAVATVGVVGAPDPVRTERVVAFVVLREGHAARASLAVELQEWVQQRLARYSYPREIIFTESLPMTVSGKVIRKELKARVAGKTGETL